MLGKLKKKLGFGPSELVVLSPVPGEAVPLGEVPDPAFQGGILGEGAAVRPSEGTIVSPVDGVVELIFETGHAVSLRSDDGIEVLIHIGLNTVQLAGEHFEICRKNGDAVKRGDVLVRVDLEAVQKKGYDTITPVIICNTEEFSSVQAHTGTTVAALEPLLTLGLV